MSLVHVVLHVATGGKKSRNKNGGSITCQLVVLAGLCVCVAAGVEVKKDGRECQNAKNMNKKDPFSAYRAILLRRR